MLSVVSKLMKKKKQRRFQSGFLPAVKALPVYFQIYKTIF